MKVVLIPLDEYNYFVHVARNSLLVLCRLSEQLQDLAMKAVLKSKIAELERALNEISKTKEVRDDYKT